MNVNPKIKLMLAEIAEQSIKYANKKDERKKYQRKLLRLFKQSMSEDEQLYVLNNILEEISYKNIIADPENMLTVGNIKLRSHFMIFVMSVIVLLLASYLFGTNDEIKAIGDGLGKLLTILGIKLW